MYSNSTNKGTGMAESVYRLATGLTVRRSNLGRGRNFPHPSRTAQGAHPDSYTRGVDSFPEVKRLRCGVDHPPTSSVEIQVRVYLYICSSSGPTPSVLGRNLILHLIVPTNVQRYPQRIKTNLLHSYWQLDLQHVSTGFIGYLQGFISSDVAN
jgi:hypothetical protein